jgi:hypothetical protein
MKKIITVLIGLGISASLWGQSSTVNPGSSPANTTTTTNEVRSDVVPPTSGVVDTSVPAKKKSFKNTVVEKSNNVKRATKKGMHQMQEMTCRKEDQKCQAMKEKHRAQEQAEFHKDKLTEAQDAVYDVDNESTP